jgi:hypothetical protein
VLDKRPESPIEIEQKLWPNMTSLGSPYDSFKSFSVHEAAESVWCQLKGERPLGLKKVIEMFENEYNVSHDQAVKDGTEFYNSAKGKQIYALSYADNDGPFGSMMEHGDVFRNIPNKQISQH